MSLIPSPPGSTKNRIKRILILLVIFIILSIIGKWIISIKTTDAPESTPEKMNTNDSDSVPEEE